ncbi:aminoglycoside phosphotransferase [Nocardioides plantarum]|uniref:Spectinomycin phosphotransferase n=1 Tax=Nocardioides plantarum TaxID=29299 RepID=A0ABV5KDQ5_9ACTN|nr:aminoglycoside phosphotransferase [Nocardioides plantarum]
MHEPPVGVDDADVLAAVRRHWAPDADAVVHLPVGFGAHHWRASRDGAPLLFVTLDGFHRHDLDSLVATYATAAALRDTGLGFVHAGLEPWAVPFGTGALSATPWLDGERPVTLDVDATAAALAALHAVEPPARLRSWRTLVGPELADDLDARAVRPWDLGPLGEQARTAITERLADIRRWVAAYHRLAEVARDRPWVTTHGQPGVHNQVLTADGLRLVDWESLLLAPPERDLRTVASGDPAMLELFALEWRLDEISLAAHRFAAPHTGTADDHEAYAALLEELDA